MAIDPLTKKRKPDPVGDASLPAIPGPVVQKPQQAFEGGRQLLRGIQSLSGAGARLVKNPYEGQPIGASTPQSEIDRRAGNAQLNVPFNKLADPDRATPVLRPTTGPQSAQAVGQQTNLMRSVGPVRPLPANVGVPGAVQALNPGLMRPAAPAADFSGVTGGARTTAAVAPAAVAPAAGGVLTRAPAAAAAPTGGVDFNGRHLPIGAMVDGVPTFSDGTAGIPRTVSDAQIAELGKGASLSRADKGALATPLASDALGFTPSTEQMVAQNMALQRPGAQGPNPMLQRMFDESDAAAIASGDPRSVLGTAASNLRMDATMGTPRSRRIAENTLAGLQRGVQARSADRAAFDRTQLSEQGANARTAATEAGANARTNVQEQGATQRAKLTMPRRSTVQLADGSLGLLDPRTGTVVPAVGAGGKPVKTLQTKATVAQQRTQSIIDQLNKGAQEQLAALTKQQLPGPDGTPAQLPPDMVSKIRLQQASLMGLQPQVNPKTGEMIAYVNGQWMPI